MVPHAGRREDERERQRIGGGPVIEPAEPRGDGSDGERRGKIGRPDAAIENRRPVDGATQPGHGFGAGEDRGDHVVRRDRGRRGRQGERGGDDNAARRRHGRKMDVVDLAQACERAPGREVERQCVAGGCALAHRGTEAQQRQTFGGARARDPGADGVDEMKLDQVARGGGRRRAACDGAAELLQRGHHAASGDDQSTSLPCSWTATIADTMAWPRSSDRPTRRL